MTISFPLSALLASSAIMLSGLVASADPPKEPTSADGYKFRAEQYLPDYKPDPIKRATEQEVEVCGFTFYELKQKKTPSGWGPATLSFNLNQGVARDCNFPKPLAKWRRYVAKARKQLPKGRFKDGDRVVILSKGWDYERHPVSGAILSRHVQVRHYSKKHRTKEKVRACDRYTVCESTSHNWRGWLVSANEADFLLEAGHTFQKDGKLFECRLSGWKVAYLSHELTKKREDGDSWNEKHTFRTTRSGELGYGAFFDHLQKVEKQGRELFTACGGDAKFLPAQRRKDGAGDDS